ncbi:hypothetical protein [Tessaracoccus oleiagri]|uniref:hypothetical protein n=1 Tax=Tessaracoccus oleiagri TaxID=686624 RepID=UPI00115FF6B3|nr:hypothetical protein [Tessaracoccus oleiagri]
MLPHLEAATDSIEWGSWWVSTQGSRSIAEGNVQNWDYSTAITFELQPAVDKDVFLESTGLDDLDLCEIVAIAECAATGYRHATRHNLAEMFSSSEKVLAIEPSPSTLAQSVRLMAHVVLARNLDRVPNNVASRRGARLAQSTPITLQLEGDGSRFPTEAVSFRSLGLDEALWSLRYDLSQPEEMFTTAVRLFINTDHPRAEQLLDGSHPEATLIKSALETDIVRQLLAGAAEFSDLFIRRDWPEASTGETLESLAESFFGHSLEELLRRRSLDLIEFERLLQARTDMFGA